MRYKRDEEAIEAILINHITSRSDVRGSAGRLTDAFGVNYLAHGGGKRTSRRM